jgi:hypothetical protein
MGKNQTEFKSRSEASTRKIYFKKCKDCEIEAWMSKAQDFCSAKCKGHYKYKTKKVTTGTQYHSISGNWKRYCQRLLYYGGRKRDKLTWQIILDKIKQQNFKCALTGELLTCNLEIGRNFRTNASVDRIIPGGAYTEDNIQIVCKAVNYWRSDLTINEFVDWCKKVVDRHKNNYTTP